MVDTIVILEHDFHDGGACEYVLFTVKDAPLRINLAAQIYKLENEVRKGAVQFHCDFTHLGMAASINLGWFQLKTVITKDGQQHLLYLHLRAKSGLPMS